jgi:hypothetical protein
MSFQDLEAGSHRTNGACKMQPKQSRHEDSPCEQHIKVNILKMQESVRFSNEQLERIERTQFSKRMSDSLNKSLERSQQLAIETEQIFRDWTVQLAGEPRVRHIKKFVYEKLERSFKEECANVNDASRRAMVAHKNAMKAEVPSSSGYQWLADEEHCLLAGSEKDLFKSLREDSKDTVAISTLQHDDNIEEIKRQQRLLFKPQDNLLPVSTKLTGVELNETAKRRLSQFERLCCGCALVALMIYLMVMHHIPPQGISLAKLAGFIPESESMAASGGHSLILQSLHLVRLG